MELAQIMGKNKVSYRSLAVQIKAYYPDSNISKSTLQEMALGIKQVLPHHRKILVDVFTQISQRAIR